MGRRLPDASDWRIRYPQSHSVPASVECGRGGVRFQARVDWSLNEDTYELGHRMRGEVLQLFTPIRW
jgi:hypothetical protein